MKELIATIFNYIEFAAVGYLCSCRRKFPNYQFSQVAEIVKKNSREYNFSNFIVNEFSCCDLERIKQIENHKYNKFLLIFSFILFIGFECNFFFEENKNQLSWEIKELSWTNKLNRKHKDFILSLICLIFLFSFFTYN